MAIKKFSFGSSDLSASKKRGGGPSMGASVAPIGQGLDLRIPTIQPQASAASTFVAPTAPRAAAATYVPQGSIAAKPNNDLENLANSFQSLNSNLKNFTTAYIDFEQTADKQAQRRAEEVAVKLRETNGNIMGKYNDLLNKNEKDSNNIKLTPTKQSLARTNLATLKTLDPRAAEFLSRSLEYQKGLQLISNAPNYIANYKDLGPDGNPTSGEIRVLKPYTDDGSPSEVDIALTDYYAQGGITSSSVLFDLQQSMVNTTAQIKSSQASKYAAKQDERLLSGYNINLENMILERKNLGDDYKNGRALTGVLDQVKHAGMTNNTLSNVNEKLIPTLANYAITLSIKPDGTLDQAKFAEIQEFLYKELANAKTGPITQKNRPSIDTKLGTSPEKQFITASQEKANAMDLINKRTNNRKWITEANKTFDTALKGFNDKDAKKEGIQPYTFELVDGDKRTEITIDADLPGLTSWYNNQIAELLGPNAEGDKIKNSLMAKQLNERLNELIKGMTTDQNEAEDVLEEYTSRLGVNPILKKTEIKEAIRQNLISKLAGEKLLRKVDAEIGAQDAQSQEIFNSYYDEAMNLLGEGDKQTGASAMGFLSPIHTSQDGFMNTDEMIAARIILRPAVTETNNILSDGKLTQEEKLFKLDKLWASNNNRIDKMIKQSADIKKKKLNIQYPFHVELENINAGNIEINPDDMTFYSKEKDTVITRKDGTTYTTLPDGELYATDNEAFVRAENNIKESNEHYEKSKSYYEQLIKDGKIKEGELVINPFIEDERRLALKYGFRYARKGELINPANLDRMKDDIDLLTTEAEQLKDPVIQNNLHWTSFSSPSYTSRGTPIQDLQSLPATFTEDTDKQQMALTNATEFSRVEASQRFKGLGTQSPSASIKTALLPVIGIGAAIPTSVEGELNFNNKYVSNWLELRTKEHFYKQGSGIDPSLRPGEATPIAGRSVLFGDTPWHIIDKIGHKRGRKADNAILNSDIRQRPLYQRYVFAEQINALEAGAPWIPYSHDLNIILEKAGVTPIDFFRQQYFVHTGNTMPAELEESITNRLIQKTDGVADPLYRKGFTKKVLNDKDQAMINNREDEILIAGNLQAGMLSPINVREVPSGLTPLAESKFDRTWESNTPLKQRQTELGTALYSAGFKDEEELTTMLAIAMAETGTRSIRNHPSLNDRDESYGALQINMLNELGPWREGKWPWLKNRNDLFDINLNSKAAYDIYKNEPWLNDNKEGLFNAWASYTTKKHLPFMDEARKRAKEILELQPQESSTIDPSSGLA